LRRGLSREVLSSAVSTDLKDAAAPELQALMQAGLAPQISGGMKNSFVRCFSPAPAIAWMGVARALYRLLLSRPWLAVCRFEHLFGLLPGMLQQHEAMAGSCLMLHRLARCQP
jgi:hypothetical protein